MRSYTTKQGDMWDGIAYTMCGSTAAVTQLMELNPEYHDIFIFPGGIRLTLPEEAIPTAELAGLPPWKRGAAG